MEIVFVIPHIDNRDFLWQSIEMPAIPQIGSGVDIGDNIIRGVKGVMYSPSEIIVTLKALKGSDTPSSLSKEGWKDSSVLRELQSMRAVIRLAHERDIGEIDFKLISQVMKEAEETCNEVGYNLSLKKRIHLIFDLYTMVLEHNKQGLSLQERVAALKKIAEG